MKRKVTALLAVLLAFALLFGCTRAGGAGRQEEEITLTEFSNTEKAAETTAAATKVASTTAAKKGTKSADKSTKKAEKSTESANKMTANNKPTTAKSQAKTTAKSQAKTTAKKQQKKPAKKAATKRSATTAKPTAHSVKPTTAATTRGKTAKGKITVTIRCTEVLDNLDKLKEGHEIYVPKSGYFLTNYTVKYEKGDNAYTVLQRTCRENGIKMRAKRTVYGMYVVGINELDEKDCGPLSGWTYYVDGKFPNVSTDNYELKGGEYVEFRYVC